MVRRIARCAFVCALAGLLTGGSVCATQTPLRVGANLSGVVMAYHDPRTGAPVGFDVDLIRAVGAKLGVPVQIRDHAFDDLFKAVKDGTFDVAISGITDTRARERIDDFVDYLLVGSGIIVQRGNPKRIFSFDSLCGRSFAVEAGTTQQAAAEKAKRQLQDARPSRRNHSDFCQRRHGVCSLSIRQSRRRKHRLSGAGVSRANVQRTL